MTPVNPIKRPSLVQMIFQDGTPKKAFYTAVIVGSVLTSINHGDVILNGSLPQVWKIALTYCVPYCVTTWGAVTGKIAEWHRLTASHSFESEGIKL